MGQLPHVDDAFVLWTLLEASAPDPHYKIMFRTCNESRQIAKCDSCLLLAENKCQQMRVLIKHNILHEA